PRPQLASKARLLIAAPRRFYVSGLHVIDPDDSRTQRFHRTESFEDIPRPDGGREPIGRIVGDLHCVFFVLERDDRRNWAEDFLASNASVVIDVVKNSRLDVVTLGEGLCSTATNCQFGFFLPNVLI